MRKKQKVKPSRSAGIPRRRCKPVVNPSLRDDIQSSVICAAAAVKQPQEGPAPEQDIDLLQALMDSIPDTIYFKGPSSRFIRINRAQADLLGLKNTQEAIGKSDFDFFDHAQQAFEDEQNVLKNDQPLIAKLECITTASKGRRWVSTTKVPLRNRAGQVIGIAGISRDVTERVKAENRVALQFTLTNILANSGSLKEALPKIPQAICEGMDWSAGEIWRIDQDYRLHQESVWRNSELRGKDLKNAKRALSFAANEVLPKHIRELAHPAPKTTAAEPEGPASLKPMVIANGRCVLTFPITCQSKVWGAMLFYSRQSKPIDQDLLRFTPDFGAQIGQFIQCRLAQEELRDHLDNVTRAEAFSQIMVSHIALDGRWLKVTPTLCRLLDYTEEELLALRVQDVTSPDNAEADWSQYLLLLQSGLRSFSSEERYRRRDGQLVWFSVNTSLVIDVEDKPVHFLTFLRDITESKRFVEQLQAQAQLLDVVLDAVAVCDMAGRIEYWNKGAEKLYGWKAVEAVGRKVESLLNPLGANPLLSCVEQALATGQWTGEWEMATRTGQKVTVESRWTLMRDQTGQPKSILIADTNLTEKRRLEAQVLRSQRMESIGRMAGGVAHDLNNILAPILMASAILRDEIANPESLRVLDTIESSANRGANLVKQILTFSRGAKGQKAPLQLNYLVKEMVKIMRASFPKSVVVKTNLPPDLWTVMGEATQLHQVMMNLCVNACDAMPDGGLLKLYLENIRLDVPLAGMLGSAEPGPYVVLTVADTGAGIAREILDHIFEPFFTTKGPAKGTGLGLSTVLGIVKSHGGAIEVVSSIGHGSEFRVYLPVVEGSIEEVKESEVEPCLKGHDELVLVIDDEEEILRMTRQILEVNGYRVLVACDGTDGIVQYVQNKNEVQLVLTDLMMPFMDGTATIRALRKINPKAKIVAVSGLGSNPPTTDPSALGTDAYLKKPYTSARLLRVLHDLLGKKGR